MSIPLAECGTLCAEPSAPAIGPSQWIRTTDRRRMKAPLYQTELMREAGLEFTWVAEGNSALLLFQSIPYEKDHPGWCQ